MELGDWSVAVCDAGLYAGKCKWSSSRDPCLETHPFGDRKDSFFTITILDLWEGRYIQLVFQWEMLGELGLQRSRARLLETPPCTSLFRKLYSVCCVFNRESRGPSRKSQNTSALLYYCPCSRICYAQYPPSTRRTTWTTHSFQQKCFPSRSIHAKRSASSWWHRSISWGCYAAILSSCFWESRAR